jgi:hypothetical protein
VLAASGSDRTEKKSESVMDQVVIDLVPSDVPTVDAKTNDVLSTEENKVPGDEKASCTDLRSPFQTRCHSLGFVITGRWSDNFQIQIF